MMKKILTALAVALVSAAMFAETIAAYSINKAKTPFTQIAPLSNVLKAKHLTVLDSENAGSMKVTLGKSGRVNTFTPIPYTKLSSNYEKSGKTITGSYYLATNGLFNVKMPRIGSASGVVKYGATNFRFNYLSDNESQEYEYQYNKTNSSGRVYEYVIVKRKYNTLDQIGYNIDLSEKTLGTIRYDCENWYTLKQSSGAMVLHFECGDQNCTNVVGSGCYSGIEFSDAPKIESKGSATLPDTFVQPLEFTNWVQRVQDITRESVICTTNYTGGVLEYNFPEGTYMTRDYYIKLESPSITNRTSDIRFIYEK